MGQHIQCLDGKVAGLHGNLVERYFNRLKHLRRIATRFDKLAVPYLAAVALASARLWTRAYVSTAWSAIRTGCPCGVAR